jgi:hypothetical protein
MGASPSSFISQLDTLERETFRVWRSFRRASSPRLKQSVEDRNAFRYHKTRRPSAADDLSSDVLSVTPNAKIKGLISGSARQIDVLIEDMRYSPSASRVIVDAKRRTRKIDIKGIEEFEGMMRDCGAKHGLIVCSNEEKMIPRWTPPHRW